MSMRRDDYGSSIVSIYAGTKKAVEISVRNPYDGTPRNMSDHSLYHAVSARICRISGDLLLAPTVHYDNRAAGVIQVAVDGTTPEMAGNHVLSVEFRNAAGDVIDRQVMGINIIMPC